MLNKIIATKQEEIKHIQLTDPIEVERVSLYEGLRAKKRSLALIAEVKKASPSKGLIREDFHPVEIGKAYERAGANAISVLTDREYFQGDTSYLTAVKKHVSLPVLRKDFIIDSLQVEETVRIGADAMLLIVAALEVNKLKELYDEAYEKGLECLVEIHSEEELEQLLAVFTPKIIGVNNRNLKTFETCLSQTERIKPLIPKGSLFVSESGIHTPEDIRRVEHAGADAILVGESLMRAATPEAGIRTLFAEDANEPIA